MTIGILEAGGLLDSLCAHLGALLITDSVQRLQDLGTDLAGLLEDRGRQVGVDLIEAGRGAECVEIHYLAQYEIHILIGV